MTFVWTPVGHLFGAIPWLAVLGLFLAKPNRCPRAWRLWIPLVLVVMLLLVLRSLLTSWNQTGADALYRVFVSLSFGVCLIWLLSTYLAQLPRPLRFFGYGFLILLAAVFHGLDLGVAQDVFPFLAMAGIGAVCVALAMSLAAVCSRRRYTVRRFGYWAFLWIILPWLAIAFIIIVVAGGANGPPIGELMLVMLGMGTATFLALLPFLVISHFEPLYAERLRGLVEPFEVPISPAPDGGSTPEPGTSPVGVESPNS